MNEKKEKNSSLDKLTEQRKLLVEQVLENLENGTGLWKQGWRVPEPPESASTGKKYHGVNNFYLTLVSMLNGYTDNRWATYNQIQENGWTFKTDEEGKSLAKGQSVTVEFYELRDRETKRRFDKSVLDGMTPDEKHEYMTDNVYPVRRYYRVFNADLIDGIPAKKLEMIDETARSERAETFIKFWGEKEVPIKYGGSMAYYSPSKDEIHLPERNSFNSAIDFCSTALHEIGHSTGHKSRLNRDLSGKFGSETYAEEELRAEIASMFVEQEFGVQVDESAIRNNSAYVKSWANAIKEDPDALFRAITDADKIAKYLVEKEKNMDKRIEKFAIVEDKNELGDPTYKLYMTREHGQTGLAIDYEFNSREELMTEFEKFKEGEFWKDAEFQEVTFSELEKESVRQAELKEKKSVKQEESEEYVRPSTIVARALATAAVINMAERGIDSLQRMCDKEVVERAQKVQGGDTFDRLYKGEKVFESDNKNEKILMMRLGMFCEGDTDMLMRVFQSSGQFRDNKPNSYYLQMAQQTMNILNNRRNNMQRNSPTLGSVKSHFGMNTKT